MLIKCWHYRMYDQSANIYVLYHLLLIYFHRGVKAQYQKTWCQFQTKNIFPETDNRYEREPRNWMEKKGDWEHVESSNNETRRKPDVSSQHKDQKYCHNWSFMDYAISLHRSTPRNKPSTTKKLRIVSMLTYVSIHLNMPCLSSMKKRKVEK